MSIREFAKNRFHGSRYLVLAEGPIELDDLIVVGPSARYDAAYDEATSVAIAGVVREAEARALANGHSFFDSRLFRLGNVIEVSTDGRKHWKMGVGRTRYFEYAGTRSRPFAGSIEGYANPIGSGVIAITEDGYIPFGRRSRIVEVNPGRIFSFGGFFDASEDLNATGLPCVYSCLRRELQEELGVEIRAEDVRLQAIVYDLLHPHPEIVATVRLRGWSAADIADSNWSAELASLELIHQDDLERYIRDNCDDITEGLLGGLCSFVAGQAGVARPELTCA